MIGSHHSVRIVSKRKKAPKISYYDFRDVKIACHKWLMKHSPEYCKEQMETPERKKIKGWDDCENYLLTEKKVK